jgi:nitrite reductase (NADH) small subunit/3-phenylpropionate/trans-cinnamate dioxygenase ferredoxin subunit
MFFSTGLFASDLQDAALFPPEYKEQFTVTGQVRRVKLKRQGPPLGKHVTVNGHSIAVFRYKAGVYAIANKCCHQGGPLFQGDIEDLGDSASTSGRRAGGTPCIACPWHGWRFNLDTGQCLHKDEYAQQVYPTRVDRGEISVGFDEIDQSQFGASEDLDF